MKKFNTAGPCIAGRHYMADITRQLKEIYAMIAEGCYFTICRARQYGKTTMLAALAKELSEKYCVISLDFQKFSQDCFADERSFCRAFAQEICEEADRLPLHVIQEDALQILDALKEDDGLNLHSLFQGLRQFCEQSIRQVVLIADEADSASNNQVFLDFLAQLRSCYLDRELKNRASFQSVILAGLYDVRNVKRKIRLDEEHKVNSPWNIAADFETDMSLSKDGIFGMLLDYESDYHTGMDVYQMSALLYDYTSGYPVLVSRLCRLMDEKISRMEPYLSKKEAWTPAGFQDAVRLLLAEKNPLFDSMTGKLSEYPQLEEMLRSLLFSGKSIVYNPDDEAADMALMFGFVKVSGGHLVTSNRIFETRLYNRFLAESEMQSSVIYKTALQDKNQFLENGRLNMEKVLERFVEVFDELYGSEGEKFYEEDGRRFFLLFLRPVINGTGNYYIESRTRNLERTDVIVDYRGEQFIIELKIWRGSAYHEKGERQLAEYLSHYHLKKGYLLSFNFNKNKTAGVKRVQIGEKMLVEAVV